VGHHAALGFVDVDDEFGAGATALHASFGEAPGVESRGTGRDRKLVIAFCNGGRETSPAGFVESGGANRERAGSRNRSATTRGSFGPLRRRGPAGREWRGALRSAI
jgi:hypothetical protein